MPAPLTFWFDPISPFAWLAWQWVGEVAAAHDRRLEPVPVLFAAILDHWGQLGPAEIPPKRRHVFTRVVRLARSRGLTVTGPACHPFNPVTALRLCLPEVSGERQVDVIDAVMNATWSAALDPADPAQLTALLDGIGVDGAAALARTREPAVKAALRTNTEAAVAAGVFGVPTLGVDGERFWGDDQRPFVEAFLRGEDPLDRSMLARLETLPTGAVRPRSG